ncbi:MAG: putative 2-succinylbenzoate--CoA ligase [Gammaproteobacteria bacterium]|nr:putative 2-succinylbenzoate--CoA ligase [Gammaproteobacteria bacterium]
MTSGGTPPTGSFHGVDTVIKLADLENASCLEGRLEELRGRRVLISARDQLVAALALVELDGVAQRLVLCPPDLSAAHFPIVIKSADADAWVRDSAMPEENAATLPTCVTAAPAAVARDVTRRRSHDTEWVLLTSGTMGAPKLVLHTLASLTSAIPSQQPKPGSLVWSTFYDIRRYGGLQIFLRATLRGGALVLSDPVEATTDFLTRAAAAGITHISGTPSHWRRALMSGAAATIAPRYVRLSGEIADQAILDNLRAAYPQSTVAHAFASTEAGVAFEVDDGLAGFPASLVGSAGEKVQLKIEGDTLHIRSDGNAARYLGEGAETLRDDDGFVDTGDRVELRNGRYHFVGRAGGVINVGGLKVYPEEVEAVINSSPWVRMSLVKARRNPITGAVVTADVVLADDAAGFGQRPVGEALTREIIEICRRVLPAHKVPTMVRIVPALDVSASGKLVRPSA